MVRPVPRATYRLQFNKEFGFGDAAKIAPYLRQLGISHVYCSPYLKARPGSSHGYDIVDHNRLNDELGDLRSFQLMAEAFRANGLSQILDFVPNHMGVGGSDNPWWLDVLEWGEASEYARWFDIEWRSEYEYLHGKLLVPFLGNQYGTELESGALKLNFDEDAGAFAVWAYDTHKLPICPYDYQIILGNQHPVLEQLGDEFAHLPRHGSFSSRASELKAKLSVLAKGSDSVREAIAASLVPFNGRAGILSSWSMLDQLIKTQHWRVAHFRVASDDINYRRFFNINDLAGLRMETPEVFAHAHELLFSLIADGTLEGIRLDHVDGLLNPKEYCRRLRAKAPGEFYLVVEKILANHETIRDDWGTDGTTGYEFANLVSGLFNHPSGEETLSSFYQDFTGDRTTFSDLVRDCKSLIMRNEMASELHVLAHHAARLARTNPRTADFTTNGLHRALEAIVAEFPVYRTYLDQDLSPTEADRRDIDWAVAQARKHGADLDQSVFEFLHKLLTGDLVAYPGSGFSRASALAVAMRVQQYSGPVMAKGLEDTAFYRFNRFLGLNEVGGHPDQYRVTTTAFHRANMQRLKHTPHALLSTSTHDTKRGEDVRARLSVLTEISEEWVRQVSQWSRILRGPETGVSSNRPDRSDEYVFYQLLVGAWPADMPTNSIESRKVKDFIPRLQGAMIKSLRESKLRTTWANPNEAYENIVSDFISSALDTERKNLFLESFIAFQANVARFGFHNSLSQAVLKLTVPGVPDIYQGAELWELSLVDPDNRRPVDYKVRSELITSMPNAGGSDGVADWADGLVKLRILASLLAARKNDPDLFAFGSYDAVVVSGPDPDRVCAYSRTYCGRKLLVAVSFFPVAADTHGWEGYEVQLNSLSPGAKWTNLITGEAVNSFDGQMRLVDLFSSLPVAVLRLG